MEVDAFVYQFLHGDPALDVDAGVGLQVADIGHRNVQEPQDDVEALDIDLYGVVHPQPHHESRDQDADQEVHERGGLGGSVGRGVALEGHVDIAVVVGKHQVSLGGEGRFLKNVDHVPLQPNHGLIESHSLHGPVLFLHLDVHVGVEFELIIERVLKVAGSGHGLIDLACEVVVKVHEIADVKLIFDPQHVLIHHSLDCRKLAVDLHVVQHAGRQQRNHEDEERPLEDLDLLVLDVAVYCRHDLLHKDWVFQLLHLEIAHRDLLLV
jgi:hypothetical protein